LEITAGVGWADQLPQNYFDDVKNGTAGVFVYGHMEYFDVFGIRRETHFRYMYGARAIANGSEDLVICEDGNRDT
jgi:hypothetical protein